MTLPQEACLPSLSSAFCSPILVPASTLLTRSQMSAPPWPSLPPSFLTNNITKLKIEKCWLLRVPVPLPLLHPTPHIASEGREHLCSWDPGPLPHRDCQGAPSRMQGPSLSLSSSGKTTSLYQEHRETSEGWCPAAFFSHEGDGNTEGNTRCTYSATSPNSTPKSQPWDMSSEPFAMCRQMAPLNTTQA